MKVTITSTTPTTTKPRVMRNPKTKRKPKMELQTKTIARVKATTVRRAMAR